MSVERVLTDIPDGEEDAVVKDFESEGCIASKEKQPNGKWTVRATCPNSKPEPSSKAKAKPKPKKKGA